MRKMIPVLIFGVATLGLSACAKHPNSGSSGRINKQELQMMSTSPTDYNTTAKSYPLPGQPGFRGDETAFFKNPLRAPANQTYYFGFASSKMRPEDLRALKLQANFLVLHSDAKIRLEGNTDDRGTREYNVGLGWRRDQSVTRLLEQQGVRPNQIQMVSYGKEHPVIDGNNPRSWSLNRRVNLVYKADS